MALARPFLLLLLLYMYWPRGFSWFRSEGKGIEGERIREGSGVGEIWEFKDW